MTGEEILAAAEAVYARCRTYADHGCVRTLYLRPDGGADFVSTTPFETAFVRPDRFRFAFATHHPNRTEYSRYVIAAHGQLVQTWWDIRPGVKQPESLAMALAAATGVSSSSAHTIPALLLPDLVLGRRLTERVTVTRLEDGELDGVTCYRVQRQEMSGPEEQRQRREELVRLLGRSYSSESGPQVLWLEKGLLLIRRIEASCRFETFQTESVTTYEPALDEPVPDDHLLFDPPEAAGA
jgi:hypothetical protein